MFSEKKKKLCIGTVVLAILIFALPILYFCLKPGRIDVGQIRSINVRLPDDAEILLSADEAEQVKGSLEKVELKGMATGFFKNMNGGTYLQFRIYFYDGTEMYFGEAWPYYVIDGEKGYCFADEELCGDLRDLYIKLLDKYYLPDNEG